MHCLAITLSAQKIIIDTDPGQDDAVAILLALASPDEIEVLGITAVAGNVPLSLTEKNARIICELAGQPNVGVYAGCDRPLKRKLVTAEHVHGKTGLDGPELSEPKVTLKEQHGVDFIIDTIMNEPANTVSLCPLGPLTNVASAILKEPRITKRIKQIVLMGGAYFEVGNITPAAAVSYTHLRAHETSLHLVCRLLLEKKGEHPQDTSLNEMDVLWEKAKKIIK